MEAIGEARVEWMSSSDIQASDEEVFNYTTVLPIKGNPPKLLSFATPTLNPASSNITPQHCPLNPQPSALPSQPQPFNPNLSTSTSQPKPQPHYCVTYCLPLYFHSLKSKPFYCMVPLFISYDHVTPNLFEHTTCN